MYVCLFVCVCIYCTYVCVCVCARLHVPHVRASPGGHKAGEVGRLVEVDAPVGLQDEARLLPEGPDHAHALRRLVEVAVDGRAAHGLQPTQLAGCGHVETLRRDRHTQPQGLNGVKRGVSTRGK